jgi:uncharacterized protein
MTIEVLLLLGGAGIVAGTVGTAGGITSLISYPALLLAGQAPLAAGEANLVALVITWPGAAIASRPELAGHGRWLRRWIPVAGLSGGVGAALLLVTAPATFAHVVPFLVAVGSLSLIAQPWLASRYARTPSGEPGVVRRMVVPVVLAALTLYNGYFGAGSGVMLLALLMATGRPHLPTANALKNMLVGAATVVPAAVFAVVGRVDWASVAALGSGLLLGSQLGPAVTRRLPGDLTRWAVALIGLGMALRLWWHPTG